MRIWYPLLHLLIGISAFRVRKVLNSKSPVMKMTSFRSQRHSIDYEKAAKSLLNNPYFESNKITKATPISELASLLSFTNIRTPKDKVRVYCLSDIHCETHRAQSWIRENCIRKAEDANAFTVFIIAGDCGSDLDRMETCFEQLVNNYDLVTYVPGNHEAWLRGVKTGEVQDGRAVLGLANDSVAKLVEVFSTAKAHGVYMGPLRIAYTRQGQEQGLCVFPLQSWFHSSWDKEPDVAHPLHLAVEKSVPFQRKWGDFTLCKWPTKYLSHEEFVGNGINATQLAESFAHLNERFLFPTPSNSSCFGQREKIDNVADLVGHLGSPYSHANDSIISFSHYLPRQELCPEKRYLIEPLLSKVVGSEVLESQIRRLQPDLHIFGHTHIPIDMELENIRYIQWPLGYYKESTRQCQVTYSAGPLLVYDSSLGPRKQGIPENLPSLQTYWSTFYQENARNPQDVMNIGPWVQARLETFAKFLEENGALEKEDTNPP